jgi:hypothetical protein
VLFSRHCRSSRDAFGFVLTAPNAFVSQRAKVADDILGALIIPTVSRSAENIATKESPVLFQQVWVPILISCNRRSERPTRLGEWLFCWLFENRHRPPSNERSQSTTEVLCAIFCITADIRQNALQEKPVEFVTVGV